MHSSIVFKEELPDIRQYWDLFLTTGWNNEYNFSPVDLNQAIQNSWYSVSLYLDEKLVGFGRIISDGIHHALIVDLIVHPEHQSKGYGRKILDRLVQKCREYNIRDIQLFAARGKYEFYEKSGFKKRPSNSPGMQLK